MDNLAHLPVSRITGHQNHLVSMLCDIDFGTTLEGQQLNTYKYSLDLLYEAQQWLICPYLLIVCIIFIVLSIVSRITWTPKIVAHNWTPKNIYS